MVRVFPTQTSATPTDELAFFDAPPMWLTGVTEVRVSCVFTWDKARAVALSRQWRMRFPAAKVDIGGPAYDSPAGDFTPGLYTRSGITITSRGCIRRCPWCFAWQREGSQIRELPIMPGNEVQDNNLLACSESHIRRVLAMLGEQVLPVRFTGGLDARLIQPWFAKALEALRIGVAFTAFDSASEWPHVERCIKLLADQAGLGPRLIKCYVLVGFGGDTPADADARCQAVLDAGATPFAQYFQPPTVRRLVPPPDWQSVVRHWSREAAIYAKPTTDSTPLLEAAKDGAA